MNKLRQVQKDMCHVMSATMIRIMQSVTLTIIVAIAIMLININNVTTDVNNTSMMTVIFRINITKTLPERHQRHQ